MRGGTCQLTCSKYSSVLLPWLDNSAKLMLDSFTSIKFRKKQENPKKSPRTEKETKK